MLARNERDKNLFVYICLHSPVGFLLFNLLVPFRLPLHRHSGVATDDLASNAFARLMVWYLMVSYNEATVLLSFHLLLYSLIHTILW